MALTGYGHEHVLQLDALMHAFALSALPRAACVSRLLHQREQALAAGLPPETPYHGYREALNGSDEA